MRRRPTVKLQVGRNILLKWLASQCSHPPGKTEQIQNENNNHTTESVRELKHTYTIPLRYTQGSMFGLRNGHTWRGSQCWLHHAQHKTLTALQCDSASLIVHGKP